MKNVFIVGSSGTTGLRLRQRLMRRTDVRLLEIDEDLRRQPEEIQKVMRLSDFCFLCLPDDASRETAKLAEGSRVRLIDASTAHRCSNDWTYGLPELSANQRREIENSLRVAVPGCHAHGISALIVPLVQSGLIPSDYPLCFTSITGYSGGGKSMIAKYEEQGLSSSAKSPMQYAMAQDHKHIPEIIMHCGLSFSPAFSPIVGDFYSGMLVSTSIHTSLLSINTVPSEVRNLLKRHYASSKLIKVMDSEPSSLYADALSGRDDMQIFVTGENDRVLLSALFDNLGKGASGTAIQCFNIMSGEDEHAGLVIG